MFLGLFLLFFWFVSGLMNVIRSGNPFTCSALLYIVAVLSNSVWSHGSEEILSLRSWAFQSVEKGETDGEASKTSRWAKRRARWMPIPFAARFAHLLVFAASPFVSPFSTDWNVELRRLSNMVTTLLWCYLFLSASLFITTLSAGPCYLRKLMHWLFPCLPFRFIAFCFPYQFLAFNSSVFETVLCIFSNVLRFLWFQKLHFRIDSLELQRLDFRLCFLGFRISNSSSLWVVSVYLKTKNLRPCNT